MSKTVDVTKVTKGDWTHTEQRGTTEVSGCRLIRSTMQSGPVAYVPNEHDADLFIEAFNVANATGLSPVQMGARLEEAERHLKEVIQHGMFPYDGGAEALSNARAFLSTKPTK